MKGLRAAFGFFTVIPVGGALAGLDDIAAAGLWLPVVAVVLGAGEGLAAWGLLGLFNPAVTAALVLALALLATGLHHTDGLADLGDAVMAGGDRARRLSVLKDHSAGAGAVAALFLVYLITWTALAELFRAAAMPVAITTGSTASGSAATGVAAAGTAATGIVAAGSAATGAVSSLTAAQLPWLLIAVEVSARLCLLLVAMISRSSHEGSGSAFISALKSWRGILALMLSAAALAAAALLLSEINLVLAAASAALLTALVITAAAKRWFGGANGDVLGASVELGRLTALLAIAAIGFQM